jgi:hypothetical protein
MHLGQVFYNSTANAFKVTKQSMRLQGLGLVVVLTHHQAEVQVVLELKQQL